MSAVQFRKVARDGASENAEAQSMEMLGRVVVSVAHDFNNLITGVLLYSDLLGKELPSDSRLQRHVSGIRRAGENGAVLIQQLLNVVRPQTINDGPVSMNSFLTETYGLLAHLVGENVELVLDKGPELWRAGISSAQLQRVVLNLVLNARDAMPQGGRILLTTRTREENGARYVELSVSDTGAGIDPKILPHLFQPFFTTKAAGSGNGLGLFTVHNIVTQNSGKLLVESELGKGTTVKVYLPRLNSKQ
jgi:two-component system, cell cycle sensor histidine kinase and response regulator CckA